MQGGRGGHVISLDGSNDWVSTTQKCTVTRWHHEEGDASSKPLYQDHEGIGWLQTPSYECVAMS